MALDATVRARVDSQLKADTEKIFAQLGLTMSQAINIFLNSARRENGIPLELKIPNEETLQAMHDAEHGIDMEEITLEEMIEEHKRGYGADR